MYKGCLALIVIVIIAIVVMAFTIGVYIGYPPTSPLYFYNRTMTYSRMIRLSTPAKLDINYTLNLQEGLCRITVLNPSEKPIYDAEVNQPGNWYDEIKVANAEMGTWRVNLYMEKARGNFKLTWNSVALSGAPQASLPILPTEIPEDG